MWHIGTATFLIIYTVLVLIAAILITIAANRITQVPEFNNNNGNLRNSRNWAIASYILLYISAGLGLLLAILYFAHMALKITSEFAHLIIFILLYVTVILAGIFTIVAIYYFNRANVSDNRSVPAYLYSGLVLAIIALLVALFSGGFRLYFLNTTKKVVTTSQTFTAQSSVNYEPSPMVSTMSMAPSYAPPVLPVSPAPVVATVPMTQYVTVPSTAVPSTQYVTSTVPATTTSYVTSPTQSYYSV
jgi:hypothetical protein